MKKLIMIFFGTLAFFECFGQKYVTWVKTSGNNYYIRGNLEYFNDSVLVSFKNPTAFTLYKRKELNFKWDEIDALKIRNENIHLLGVAIGAEVGIISALIINKSIKENTGNIITGTFGLIFADIGAVGAGILADHLVTSVRIAIPLKGKTATEKSQALKNRISKIP